MKSIQINKISLNSIMQELRKELKMYEQDKNSVKEFYPCTQELTKYLETKKK